MGQGEVLDAFKNAVIILNPSCASAHWRQLFSHGLLWINNPALCDITSEPDSSIELWARHGYLHFKPVSPFPSPWLRFLLTWQWLLLIWTFALFYSPPNFGLKEPFTGTFCYSEFLSCVRTSLGRWLLENTQGPVFLLCEAGSDKLFCVCTFLKKKKKKKENG